MALFGKSDKDRGQKGGRPAPAGIAPVMARTAYCRICGQDTHFSKCWLRNGFLAQCPCCGAQFEDARALYEKFQAACPHCGEFLEQPSFEYGLCDACGSKYELVPGCRPGLLPNKQQRDDMDKIGRVRIRE